MRAGILVLLAVLVVSGAGCATTGKLEEKMHARVGQNVNDVIDEIGPPSQTFKKPNGDTIYTWINQGPTRAVASRVFGQTQFEIQNNYCNINYVAGPEGIIKSWQHQGNTCRSN